MAAQYAFPFGLGFTANYTFSDTSTEFSTEFSNDFANNLPLPGVSRHSFNGQVYFEKGGFAARASYAWRSKAYPGNFGFGDGG